MKTLHNTRWTIIWDPGYGGARDHNISAEELFREIKKKMLTCDFEGQEFTITIRRHK